MPKYDVKVQLSGEDGNAFAILGRVQRALKEAGASKIEIDRFTSEATAAGYDDLIRTCMAWVKVR